MHRVGLIVVRIGMPCWTLFGGALLLWYGVNLSSTAPGDAWPIILVSSLLIVASIWLLWFLNRRGASERWAQYSLPDEDPRETGDDARR